MSSDNAVSSGSTGPSARVTLPLTAFLLRPGVDPQTAWTSISSAERLDDLGEFATTAVDLARGNNYQEAFSWIDNIRPIEDQDLVRELRYQLVDELTADPGRADQDRHGAGRQVLGAQPPVPAGG